MILHPKPYSTRKFLLIDGVFVAEASDLARIDEELFGLVYDDACDAGLTLVSAKTGREVVYVIVDEKRRDGDLLYYDLLPADLRERREIPTSVRIFND